MLRLSAAVVLGYITTVVIVFSGLSLLYGVLGADGAFRPGVYEVSMLWIVLSCVIGFAAALLGGWVARRIGRDVKAPRALAVVVVILGVGLALPALLGGMDAVAVREGAPPMFDAMSNARTPAWVLLLNPLLGALGVLLGGGGLRSEPSVPREVARVA